MTSEEFEKAVCCGSYADPMLRPIRKAFRDLKIQHDGDHGFSQLLCMSVAEAYPGALAASNAQKKQGGFGNDGAQPFFKKIDQAYPPKGSSKWVLNVQVRKHAQAHLNTHTTPKPHPIPAYHIPSNPIPPHPPCMFVHCIYDRRRPHPRPRGTLLARKRNGPWCCAACITKYRGL